MHLDPLFLSRLQWAWVIAWHILLPAFTVGLASFIALLEGLHFVTGREVWFRIAGWTTTEVGRQPWTIYGLMRTADSVSPSLTGGNVLGSLLLYMAVYLVMFPAGIAFMVGIVRSGVQGEGQHRGPVEGLQSATPFKVPAE